MVIRLLSIAIAATLTGCSSFHPREYSGIFPAFSPRGYIVEPSSLCQFTSGGSLSTLWYRGSDSRYHYFTHLFKARTHYRVKRSDLTLEEKDEFELDTKENVLLTHYSSSTLASALYRSRE